MRTFIHTYILYLNTVHYLLSNLYIPTFFIYIHTSPSYLLSPYILIYPLIYICIYIYIYPYSNRLFDSQNNNRGGYNVGDRTDQAFNGGNPTLDVDAIYNPTNKNAAQYPMVYYEGSELPIQWTQQHGCGGSDSSDPHNLNCNMVIQYTCDTDNTQVTDQELKVELRDGGNTNAPDATATANQVDTVANNNRVNQRGLHENEYYYYMCRNRQRNKGLFTADQNVRDNIGATATRQNPNGDRYGLECPEERDYYPYWYPTIWRDIAYITSAKEDKINIDICDYVNKNSQNNNDIYKCQYGDINSNTNCNNNNRLSIKHDIPPPECKAAQWSRDNHLGDTSDANYANYTWTLPTFEGPHRFDRMRKYGSNNDMVKCVLRIRYNISTDDYDPWNTDSKYNWKKNSANDYVRSPVVQNPTVDIGADMQGLRLAVNTAQFGRTFQDRTHIFYIKKRPASLVNKRIINLNVRGKRGNIVQTYPAVEYDFVPQVVTMNADDVIHVQWTGSNTHNNGGNGGDGQAGDDGEGTGGTDRNNIALTLNEGDNYPMAIDKDIGRPILWHYTTCRDLDGNIINNNINNNHDNTTCPLILATSGYYRTIAEAQANPSSFNPQLNNAPASLIGGVVLQFKTGTKGRFTYICTRNNNFSNRSQKGVIIIN